MPESVLIGLRRVADYLDISYSQASYASKRGHFPNAYHGPDNRLIIPISDLDRYRAFLALPYTEQIRLNRERFRRGLTPCSRCGLLTEDELCPLCVDELAGHRHWPQAMSAPSTWDARSRCHAKAD